MYVSNTVQANYLSMQKMNDATKNTSSSLFENEEKEGVKRLDFTNMSRSDMRATVNNLIMNGQMDMDESSSLLGLMSNIAVDKENFNPLRDNQPINFIEALKDAISYNQSIGNEAGVKYANLALNSLEKLQNAPTGINIKV